jgi:methoxymalonate biosynthesis acyl carrier protein
VTSEGAVSSAEPTEETLEKELVDHLEARTKATVTPDRDLFTSGLVSSLFAMELIVHLEKTYGVSITGADLRVENFRSVQAMTDLVLRLLSESATSGDG